MYERSSTMNTRRLSNKPGRRATTGAAILGVARVVDTGAVKDRLDTFAKTHQSFLDTERHVGEVESQLREARAQLGLRDSEQDAALEQLARSLVTDGEPRSNPFGHLG